MNLNMKLTSPVKFQVTDLTDAEFAELESLCYIADCSINAQYRLESSSTMIRVFFNRTKKCVDMLYDEEPHTLSEFRDIIVSAVAVLHAGGEGEPHAHPHAHLARRFATGEPGPR